ncbi:hypothetical protein LIER_41858 [Lithospermum erythrorhizon]|uniref:DM2 domain-containing protein n=1 Tax=Lithospermum erythrorhizon TaxID=34254 RepID=A0AAV3RFI0_LITER
MNAYNVAQDSKALAREKEISSPLPVHSFSLQVATTPLAPSYLDCDQRAKLMCTHCRQRGHNTTTCFKIHGYPDWWEERNKKRKSATRTAHVRANVVVQTRDAEVVDKAVSSCDSLVDLKPDQDQRSGSLIGPTSKLAIGCSILELSGIFAPIRRCSRTLYKCSFFNVSTLHHICKSLSILPLPSLLSIYILLQKDFNFERKDWMTVQVEELPEGSNLVNNRYLT